MSVPVLLSFPRYKYDILKQKAYALVMDYNNLQRKVILPE